MQCIHIYSKQRLKPKDSNRTRETGANEVRFHVTQEFNEDAIDAQFMRI